MMLTHHYLITLGKCDLGDMFKTTWKPFTKLSTNQSQLAAAICDKGYNINKLLFW